jgi:DNA helicase II / ATP-dependent DNA helicase PcrA
MDLPELINSIDVDEPIDVTKIDLSEAIPLKDSDEFIDIETNFKLCAGPGAGKTRFLINHINNVITNSKRLTNVKKIACITYTNIGVETITKRLDNAVNEIEVSTIHSFLYKHVIKPYLWVINEEYNIPLAKVDGHDEIIPTFRILEKWAAEIRRPYILYGKISIPKAILNKRLMSLQWEIQEDGEIIPVQRGHPRLPIKKDLNESLIKYKEICWEKALISHDDILFLSYSILKANERILEILRAKFPYIFIDEFQDTNPIQSEIIKMIGKKETIIGVIGDCGQSIFEFLGADFRKFIEFKLEDMELYKIENNYRSTEQIISLLNYVRNEEDFKQTSPKNKTGKVPQILVGDYFDAYEKAIEISGDKHVCTLSRTNKTSNIMKRGYKGKLNIEDINGPLFRGEYRGWLITYTITAIEYCLQNKIKDAMKYMKKAYRRIDNFGDKQALENLIWLVNNYSEYKNGSIKDFYNTYLFGYHGVSNETKITPKIRNDNEYYTKLKYKEIAVSVQINDDDSLHRTIHKSKGDEFNSVLLIIPPGKNKFNENKELNFLLNPRIDEDEENRVYYVALSRAIENLFINVPQLSKGNRKKLEGIGFEVIELNN